MGHESERIIHNFNHVDSVHKARAFGRMQEIGNSLGVSVVIIASEGQEYQTNTGSICRLKGDEVLLRIRNVDGKQDLGEFWRQVRSKVKSS